ncbi:SGNH/GDSL hydrolase family protein [Georgenia sp. AZ-5]|uniref:SGNH/GDSL hydrolase family protein n=1 Tax=Georgenia sp. AZ-5 TaxID=3367526 RepID=UPI0037550F63
MTQTRLFAGARVAALAFLLLFVVPATEGYAPPDAGAGGWYVQLGDSLAAGFQPAPGASSVDPAGGYADEVLRAVRSREPETSLVNLGCPGATTVTMIEGGGACRYDAGSQLAQAVEFLDAHARTTRLVTVVVGANDILPLVRGGCATVECLAAPLEAYAAGLAVILDSLRTAAAKTDIVVLNYYNPVLASWLLGAAGQQAATASVALQGALNAVIAAEAAAVGAAVADVGGAFSSTDLSVTAESAPLPRNVNLICAWTWMCTDQDIHPNDAGYAVIGAAVAQAYLDEVMAGARPD